MLDGPAQRLAHVALRERRRSAQQRVADVASGGRGQAQEALRRRVEPVDALQQQVAQAARKLAGPVGGREELLGEERVALGAGDDRVRQGGRHRGVGAGREQRRQVVALERAELEQGRRARAPDAVGEPTHPLGRGRVVGAIGREQENPPVVEVVGEEDDQVERRRVRPVQILEHEQHRCGGGALGEQRERLLEDPQLRARGRPVDLPKVSERPQRLDERLVGQLRADEIDRAPEQDLEALGTGTPARARTRAGSCRCPPPRRRGRSAPHPAVRRVERTLELRELACTSDEGGASLHRGQYRAVTRGEGVRTHRGTRYGCARPKIRLLARCARGSSAATITATSTNHEEASR